MTKYKKDFPLSILETVEELLKSDSTYFETTDPGESLLKFKDKDPKSDFYFEIKGYGFDNNRKLSVDLSFKPRHKDIPAAHEKKVEAKSLGAYLKNWTDILAEYERIKIFDDPILKQYQDEFLADFELLDEDADTKSYDYKTQVWLDEYLDKCKTRLIEIKTEENGTDVEQAERDINELKNTQTSLTKRKVVEKLTKIWARTRKLGIQLIKEFYQEAKKEIIKQLIKGQIDIM
jgi:hypothetical protein